MGNKIPQKIKKLGKQLLDTLLTTKENNHIWKASNFHINDKFYLRVEGNINEFQIGVIRKFSSHCWDTENDIDISEHEELLITMLEEEILREEERLLIKI